MLIIEVTRRADHYEDIACPVPQNYRNDKMDSFQSLSMTVGEPSIMDFTIYL